MRKDVGCLPSMKLCTKKVQMSHRPQAARRLASYFFRSFGLQDAEVALKLRGCIAEVLFVDDVVSAVHGFSLVLTVPVS